MRFLVVDDEPNWRRDLVAALREAVPNGEILTASGGREAMAACDAYPIDVAFLDVEMPEMDGLLLETELRKRCPALNSILVTAYPGYALRAFRQHISGYLIKPVSAGAILEELKYLRSPVAEAPRDARLQVRCCGFFEVFRDGAPLHFSRKRSKELLAFLVLRRGASASIGELCAALFEDDSARSRHHLRVLLDGLRGDLRACGAEDVLLHAGRSCYAVDPEKLDCDWYRAPHLLEKEGFMLQYTWAEHMNTGQVEL